MSRAPGDRIDKAPTSFEPQGLDWTAHLAELGAGVTITTSTWAVSGPDSALSLSDASILAGSVRTQVWLTGGTLGAIYLVTNTITTNSSPAAIDPRSFYVRIVI